MTPHLRSSRSLKLLADLLHALSTRPRDCGNITVVGVDTNQVCRDAIGLNIRDHNVSRTSILAAVATATEEHLGVEKAEEMQNLLDPNAWIQTCPDYVMFQAIKWFLAIRMRVPWRLGPEDFEICLLGGVETRLGNFQSEERRSGGYLIPISHEFPLRTSTILYPCVVFPPVLSFLLLFNLK